MPYLPDQDWHKDGENHPNYVNSKSNATNIFFSFLHNDYYSSNVFFDLRFEMELRIYITVTFSLLLDQQLRSLGKSKQNADWDASWYISPKYKARDPCTFVPSWVSEGVIVTPGSYPTTFVKGSLPRNGSNYTIQNLKN